MHSSLVRLVAIAALLLAIGSAHAETTDTIRIGAWNIEHLGNAKKRVGPGYKVPQKASDIAAVVQELRLDALAVEEVYVRRSSFGLLSDDLWNVTKELNGGAKTPWRYIMFANRRQDDTSQLVGMLWNSDRLEAPVPQGLRVPTRDFESDYNVWDRHPYAFKLRVKGTDRSDFVLVPLHMKAGSDSDEVDQRGDEADLLMAQLGWIEKSTRDMDIILLGDFNTVDADEQCMVTFAEAGFIDFNSKDKVTHPAANKPFDRVLMRSDQPETKVAKFEVYPPSDLASFKRDLSDHVPVIIELSLGQDDDKDSDAGWNTETLTKDEERATASSYLLSTLWMQTSAEWEATSLQAYRLASQQLRAAAADKSWSADLEQERQGGFQDKTKAVILDLDETVLDNTPSNAQLTLELLGGKRDSDEFDATNWADWVNKHEAKAIPGAVAFVKDAISQGVKVFYLSNRDKDAALAATKKNLDNLGILVPDEQFKLQTAEAEKQARRDEVAKNHRILLLIGDDFGDFMAGTRGVKPEKRRELLTANASKVGTRWIFLSNPIYGGWLRAMGKVEDRPDYLRGWK